MSEVVVEMEERGDASPSSSKEGHISREDGFLSENSVILKDDSSLLLTESEKKKRRRFQPEEDKKIIEGVQKFSEATKGGTKSIDWGALTKWAELDRTKEQIRSRYKLLQSKKVPNNVQKPEEIIKESPDKKKFKFTTNEEESETSCSSSLPSFQIPMIPVNVGTQTDGPNPLDLQNENENYKKEIEFYKKKLEEIEQKNLQDQEKSKQILIELMKERGENERKNRKNKIRENCIKIGQINYIRKGIELFEEWQNGELLEELEKKIKENDFEKEKFEKLKKNVQKLKGNLKKHSESNEEIRNSSEQEEIYKNKLQHLKNKENELKEERDRLFLEKNIQIRLIKIDKEEEKSTHNNFPVFSNRYLLMNLLGKGGFSEVYKAYDLQEFRIVACKIHQLSPSWKDSRKSAYIKHVSRECKIHMSIDHPRVVKMYDSFSLDNNTFITVLEYCDGYDLDMYLKIHKSMPEREAKLIMSQIFSGLKYLNEQKQKIIHFDLKPANILFTDDGIKLTDFGLSKIMEEEDAIELTSQGAGTYWYLPPECFEMTKTPKISSKVDVWSAGVIFFQLLYGQKPFGNELTQQKILQERTITTSSQVQFPQKPSITEDAKKFIQRCLTPQQEQRPDVLSLYNDKYFQGKKKDEKSN